MSWSRFLFGIALGLMLKAKGLCCQLDGIMLGLRYAPVAQLDRAAASEAVGQKFESSRAHHHFYWMEVRATL